VSLNAWSSAEYSFPLPDSHRFPLSKYALLRDRVLQDRTVDAEHLHGSERIPRDDLLLVHTADYVDRFTNGELSRDEQRKLGFPWSSELVERSYRTAAGTSDAARCAMRTRVAMNLAGGTHHAFPAHGEGFCVFNDVAVAIRAMQRDGIIRRAAVVDLDVHQGNGTNAIFESDATVFTFSMHGGRNYPFHKVPGNLDVELADGTGDDEYLARLVESLPGVLSEAEADIVFYLAGADPHETDRLGRLAMTYEGLARRDSIVLESCREIGVPVAITIAGGYAEPIDATIAVHANTARIASRLATSV
jgi:acetoin utilization deacetylase AcuC-like enzyme